MKNVLNCLLNLLKVKSLFSLMAMFIVIYGVVKNTIHLEYTMSIVTLIIGFYFNKKDSEEK